MTSSNVLPFPRRQAAAIREDANRRSDIKWAFRATGVHETAHRIVPVEGGYEIRPTVGHRIPDHAAYAALGLLGACDIDVTDYASVAPEYDPFTLYLAVIDGVTYWVYAALRENHTLTTAGGIA